MKGVVDVCDRFAVRFDSQTVHDARYLQNTHFEVPMKASWLVFPISCILACGSTPDQGDSGTDSGSDTGSDTGSGSDSGTDADSGSGNDGGGGNRRVIFVVP